MSEPVVAATIPLNKQKVSAAAPAPAGPVATAIYEFTVPGPVKVGGVLAYQGARLRLTTNQAASLNAAQPGTVRFLGV